MSNFTKVRNCQSCHLSLWLLIALILTLGSNFYGQAVEGVITGTVYDPSGEAIMPGVEVVVRGDRVNQKAVSDNAGSYRFHIPPGNYEISASQNNLYPLRRSSIHVVSGQTITINLYPSFQLRTQALVATKRHIVDEYTYWPESKFELITVRNWDNCLIEFKKRKINCGATEYTSDGFDKVKLTSGSLTVLATHIRVESSGKVRAVGEVLIDDGGKRTRTAAYDLPASY